MIFYLAGKCKIDIMVKIHYIVTNVKKIMIHWGTQGTQHELFWFHAGYLLGFPLRIGVCVFGLSGVFLELLIEMLGCSHDPGAIHCLGATH